VRYKQSMLMVVALFALVGSAQAQKSDPTVPPNQPHEMVSPKGASAAQRPADFASCKDFLVKVRAEPVVKSEVS
jgi:hypothetical protein